VNRIVLDTSALLAILNDEPGAEIFIQRIELLESATMSAVNVSEAYGTLVRSGIRSDDAWQAVIGSIPHAVDFDMEQARITGELLPQTRSLGLSLGDRACLALGIALKAPIYTADRAWKGLRLGVSIHVIR
jgi:ribonuclease VapC